MSHIFLSYAWVPIQKRCASNQRAVPESYPYWNPSPGLKLPYTSQITMNNKSVAFSLATIIFFSILTWNPKWPFKQTLPISQKLKNMVKRRRENSTSEVSNDQTQAKVFPGDPVRSATFQDNRCWKGFCEIESEPVRIYCWLWVLSQTSFWQWFLAFFNVLLENFGISDVKVQEVVSLEQEFLDSLPFVANSTLHLPGGYWSKETDGRCMVWSSYSNGERITLISKFKAARRVFGSQTRLWRLWRSIAISANKAFRQSTTLVLVFLYWISSTMFLILSLGFICKLSRNSPAILAQQWGVARLQNLNLFEKYIILSPGK